ncbi:hypothetical protein HAX54_049548 [Datura stramonium]|uniref:Uncharacterized protein n=1 Tax=Datura stramonium TaxID=4076 RepID=A0ABS8SV02_DATST|nr:hypothetical protein [Datura stramonium]
MEQNTKSLNPNLLQISAQAEKLFVSQMLHKSFIEEKRWAFLCSEITRPDITVKLKQCKLAFDIMEQKLPAYTQTNPMFGEFSSDSHISSGAARSFWIWYWKVIPGKIDHGSST